MLTTGKWQCREVVNLLTAYGVEEVVLCPGTRNTPLIMACVRHPHLKVHSVIDERSAAFIAYGMSRQSGKPVAVICTSGSAVLNLTPAISEAYYAHVPLIAVTADRPAEWVDQDDSQTLRQQHLMNDFTVASVNVTCHCDEQKIRKNISRDINVALYKGITAARGPVHINVEIDEPISEEVELELDEALSCRKLDIHGSTALHYADLELITKTISSTGRIMVVCGFDTVLTPTQCKDLIDFCRRSNVALFSEMISNVYDTSAITMIDEAMVSIRSDKSPFYPELVITFGGALVSRALKEFIRESGARHWMVGHFQATPDCYSSLSDVFPDATSFIEAIKNIPETESDYSARWNEIKQRNTEIRKNSMLHTPWSDLLAINTICKAIPQGWHLQLSNGMSVRYAMGVDVISADSISCNRGVSGIDGSFSTAVGAASVSKNNTLFITGDMSAQYDMGAMASTLTDSRLRVVVMANGGGEIFRFIKTTGRLPELDDYIAAHVNFPAQQLAQAFGFKYLEANNVEQLNMVIPELFGDSDKPVLLTVHTNGAESAKIFHDYFKNFKYGNQKLD